MKIKTVLISLFAVLSCLFGITVKAETTAPSSFKVNASDLHNISTTYYLPGDFVGGNLSMHFKKNANGEIIYCIEIHDYSVSSGSETYILDKELEAKYAYVIEKGYPKSYMFGSNNKDYFTTGLAIWYLSNPDDYIFKNFNLQDGTYKSNKGEWIKSDIVEAMAKLINGSKNYLYVEPTIKTNISDNILSLSQDGKYYVSKNIKVNTTGNITDKNYTVTLTNAPSNTIITDINGNEKNTFKTDEEFIIKVPEESIKTLSIEFKINVSSKGYINKAYKYVPSNSYYQNVAVLYPENKDLNDSLTLKINKETEILISKQNITTKEELPGAKLTVKDSNGTVMDTWVSGDTPHPIKNLKPGKYTLTEMVAPEGYILSKETVEFTVKEDGKVDAPVVMYNEPTLVKISKQDITSKEELPGATLTVKDSEGNVKDTWISENNPHEIKYLKPGKYTLTETNAPEGYILSTETVEFTINEDGTIDKPVIMYNKKEEKIPEPNKIYISKKDITTGEELAGAYLEIKNEAGEVVEAWVSDATPYPVEGLKPGKHTLTETMAPEGYELSKEVVEFIVKEDGTVDKDVIMYNTPETIVEVPPTASFKTYTASIIGIIIIGLGSLIIYRNYKKNEQK